MTDKRIHFEEGLRSPEPKKRSKTIKPLRTKHDFLAYEARIRRQRPVSQYHTNYANLISFLRKIEKDKSSNRKKS